MSKMARFGAAGAPGGVCRAFRAAPGVDKAHGGHGAGGGGREAPAALVRPAGSALGSLLHGAAWTPKWPVLAPWPPLLRGDAALFRNKNN